MNRQEKIDNTLGSDDYGDWHYVFAYASSPDVVVGDTCSNAGFTKKDVAKILYIVDGQNDGPTWIGVFFLKDKRFACVRAGCDYTGWGCQESGSSNVSSSLKRLVQFGLDKNERERLGIITGTDAMEDVLI